ncbi:DUF3631 domain-containing protein [Propionibacterium freudenreichii]|uniref:DUF3631 domain-containing protein n=1 Tax=Propionibacterium freudenreichii TaxID=1744 RepID=UPI0012FE63D0|nr:DUF3631 domain-containing protein [Propionibacterium freudenreichii]MDK9627919.1 DUF3631 domain-containing protein [Propionibacterium freudenreichii]MDK9652152.1 DUF3631 domain-containing protein [Propionibacterium freudenreichii]
MLDDVRAWLARFVFPMRESDIDVLTLWAVHTHVCQETYTSPRLLIDSPMPGSGKTTTLEHLQRLCLKPVQMASVSSPALLTRMLKDGPRTLLIDEADRSLDPKKDGVGDLIAVLNSGYKRGATRPVLVPVKGGGWEAEEMPTFAPVAMAGNNPALPDDTRARCIRVLLLPDNQGHCDESDWEIIEDDARRLGSRLADWAEHHRDQIRNSRPDLPEGVTGRARERWLPLKRVAVAAGGRWPQTADNLAVYDREQMKADLADGLVRERPAMLLLRDLARYWPESTAHWPSQAIRDTLIRENPDMWSRDSPFGRDITTKRLGKMLAQGYGVHSRQLRRGGPRGYVRRELEPVWHRMGMTPSASDESDAPDESDAQTPDPASHAPRASHASDTGGPPTKAMQGPASHVTPTTGSASHPAEGVTPVTPVTPLHVTDIASGHSIPTRPRAAPTPSRQLDPDWLLFPGSTTCKDCGNDLLTETGALGRCIDHHLTKPGQAA